MGCLNLFGSERTTLTTQDIALAQGLSDVATISISQHRLNDDSTVRERQLQQALDSRTVIEQARGLVAAQRGVDMKQAFTWLRNDARSANRSRNRRLTDVANDVIVRTIGGEQNGEGHHSL